MENTVIKTRVVGVDISLERTTFAIVDVRGNIIASDFMDTLAYATSNEFVTTLCERIIELVTANGGYETIRSVGVSAPSANFVTGCMENSPNLPWKGVIPLAALMRDQLGLAVGVANDAHSTALGERAYGSAHGMKDFIVLNIGFGLGSCFFSAASTKAMAALRENSDILASMSTAVSAPVARWAVWSRMSQPVVLS